MVAVVEQPSQVGEVPVVELVSRWVEVPLVVLTLEGRARKSSPSSVAMERSRQRPTAVA